MYDPAALVEEYKKKVAAEVKSSRARNKLVNSLSEEAATAHRRGKYGEALDKFAHLLAIVELDPNTSSQSDTRATVVSNIGSALHFLGETELAKVGPNQPHCHHL